MKGLLVSGHLPTNPFNAFDTGFCLYGQGNTTNAFVHGVITDDETIHQLYTPDSTLGLHDALYIAGSSVSIPATLHHTGQMMMYAHSANKPAYIQPNTPPLSLPSRTVRASHLVPGRIHTHHCAGNQKLTFTGINVLRNIVLVTSCQVIIPDGMTLENVVLLTTNSHQNALTVGEDVQIGTHDNCTPGGTVQLLSTGGITIGENAAVHGGHIDDNGPMVMHTCGTAGKTQYSWWDILFTWFWS